MASKRKNFGVVALAGTSSSASVSKSVLDPSVFYSSWKATATNSNGDVVVAQHSILHPSGGIAFFHMMLDASFSTKSNVMTGDKKPVFEYLLNNFEQLVTGADTPMLPDDIIYVWTFNRKTTLLCRVEKKSFHAQLDSIHSQYKKELNSGSDSWGTHLHDAVATVMARVRPEYQANKNSDIFLTLFTDGEDQGSRTSMDDMMVNVQGIGARLHTIFITANMLHTSELYKRLESQRSEMNLIDCETTEPAAISRAFHTLRSLIKSYLVVQQNKGGKIHTTRIAAYGADKNEVANELLAGLYLDADCSLIDGLYQMSIQGRDRIEEVESYERSSPTRAVVPPVSARPGLRPLACNPQRSAHVSKPGGFFQVQSNKRT